MATEQQENIEKASESVDNVDTAQSVDNINALELQKFTVKQSKWLLLLGLFVLFIGGMALWHSVSSSQKPSQRVKNNLNQARLAVRTVPVNLEAIQAWVYGDGTVSAVTKKHLTFQAEGTIDYIKKVAGRDLREGDRVKKGELLARVDRRNHDADIIVAAAGHTEAKNQVRDAVANLRQAEESLAQAKAELQKANTDKAFAQTDLKRYQELVAEGAIERRELDLKETNYKNASAGEITAEAGVRSAKAQLAAAKTRVETAQAGVKSANAKLTQSNVKGEDTEIVAPFDSIISRLNIREGDYWTPQIINAGADYQNIIERVPIIVIDPNRFEVNVELPAFQGAQVKPGQRAFIILERDRFARFTRSKASSGSIVGEDLMKLASAQGRVFSVSPSVSPGERSVRVTIRVNRGLNKIQDGEQVSAWIATNEKSRTTIAPLNAFVLRDRKSYVFVVNEEKGIVEQRAIKAGIEGLAKQEIIQGVKPGEKLVTEGKNRLVNGAPVEIIP